MTFESFGADPRPAPDLADLSESLERELQNMGFDRFAYRAANVGGYHLVRAFLGNYPLDWVKRYDERQYRAIDPVVIAAEQSILPFQWGPNQTVRPRTEAQRAFFREAHDFGIINGLTAPIHGHNGELAMLTVLGPSEDNEFDRVCTACAPRLLLTAICYHDAVRRRQIDKYDKRAGMAASSIVEVETP